MSCPDPRFPLRAHVHCSQPSGGRDIFGLLLDHNARYHEIWESWPLKVERDPGVIHTSHNLPTKKKNGTGFRLTQWLKLEVTVVKGGEGWGLSPSLFSDKKTLIFGRNEHPKKNRDFLTQVAFPTRQRIKKKLRSRAKFFRIPHS